MPNDISKVTPKILAAGLMTLRENAILSRIVNTSYSTDAAQRGSTVDVPLPSAISAADVTPGVAGSVSSTDMAPTTVPITLSNWKRSAFYLTDKEILEAMNGVIPMQASAAMRSLINQIDISILNAAYQSTWQFIGAQAYVGFNPDSAYTGNTAQKTKDATDLRLVLTKGLASPDMRMAVVTPDVEANALQLRAFSDTSWSGQADAMVNGDLNRKLGFQWFMDQNIQAHTIGTITGTIAVNGTVAAGATTVSVATDAAEAIQLFPGDLVKFANHAQNYVVRTGINIGASTNGTFTISPPLVQAVTGSTVAHSTTNSVGGATSFANAGVVYNSVAFQREAVAFASRQFEPVPPGLGVITEQAVDPISGIAVRLEVKREEYRTRFSYDSLWGTAVIRPENVVRLITIA